MAQQWAKFDQSNPQQARVVPDDNDEDFGGFEAAEPVVPNVAQGLPTGLEARPSPWAVYPAGGANLPPDLLRAQNAFPQCLDPAAENFAASNEQAAAHASNQLRANGNPPLYERQFNPGNDRSPESPPSHEHAALANDILDGSFKSVHSNQSNPMYQRQAQAAFNQNQGIENLDLARGIDDGASSYLTRDEVAYNSFAKTEMQYQAFGDAGPNVQQEEMVNDVVGDVAIATEKDEQIDHLLKEKMNFQKELDELIAHNVLLEEKLAKYQDDLDKQQRRYDETQEQHASALADIRQAGHDSLSVVVEEYKELSKLAVLQQQEASERQLKAAMTAEAEKCQERLQAQHERLEKVLDEEREKMSTKLAETMEEQRKEQQKEFDAYMEKEIEKHRNDIKTTVEEEKEMAQKALDLAVEAEREKNKILITEQREEMKGWLEEERQSSKQAMEEAVEKALAGSKDQMVTAIEEERERSKQVSKESVEKTREEMKAYAGEQRKADNVLHRRQYAALDIFLESSRKLLDVLMEQSSADNNAES